MAEPTWVVREAVAEDCGRIARMIQDLADYEKMPDGPKIDAAVLVSDGFGPVPYYSCLVAESAAEKRVFGYSLFFYTYSARTGRSVYMEDIYVAPEDRGGGAGKRLWTEVVKSALTLNCFPCEFSVLSWNAPSIAFYERLGAIDTTKAEGRTCLRFDAQAMKNFVKAKSDSPKPSAPATWTVRKAEKKDCDDILRLVKELAAFEKTPEGPKIDREILERDGFGSSPLFECFVAEDLDLGVIGFVLYHFTYSTWEGKCAYLADLFVDSRRRGRGVARQLVATAIEAMISAGCARCNLTALSWNSDAIKMYSGWGAVDLTKAENWHTFRLGKDEMVKMAQQLG